MVSELCSIVSSRKKQSLCQSYHYPHYLFFFLFCNSKASALHSKTYLKPQNRAKYKKNQVQSPKMMHQNQPLVRLFLDYLTQNQPPKTRLPAFQDQSDQISHQTVPTHASTRHLEYLSSVHVPPCAE